MTPTDKQQDQPYFDTSNLYVFIYKYRKLLISAVVLSAVISTVVSLNIQEKYKAEASIFPSNTSSIAKVLINPNYGGMADIMGLGEEERSEQLLEFLSSDKLRSKVIEEFDLMHHYKIDDQESETPYHDLYETFESNITFTRNKNMAVVIEVMDHSPDTAALLASAILRTLDDVMNDIQKERAIQGFKIVEKSYLKSKAELDEVQDSLKSIMGKGVLNVQSQSEVYGDAYAQAIAKNNLSAIKALEEKMELLSKYGSQYLSLREYIETETVRLTELKAKYEEAKVDANERVKNFFVVKSPFAPEKKSYPVRWLIVALSVIGTLLSGILGILFFEQFQKVRAQL